MTLEEAFTGLDLTWDTSMLSGASPTTTFPTADAANLTPKLFPPYYLDRTNIAKHIVVIIWPLDKS